jgi:S1-C subfamily serine protease
LLRFVLTWAAVGLVVAALLVLLHRPQAQIAAFNPAGDLTAPAVQRAQASVVSISANRLVRPRAALPQNPAAQQFFGASRAVPERSSLQRSVGSAVVVSTDGDLLTNRHVVNGYDEIRVELNDGRTVHATLVGSDADTDLALLKVDLEQLPAIEFAAADQLKVGAMVLAIGNPFGFGQSVSLGVISALDRSLNSTAPFIQTDAAINNGSSGGALINLQGQLVGINALVLNRRLAEGIAFAIPADVAADVYQQIKRQGFVTRGWIGVGLDNAPMLDAQGEQVIGVRVQGIYGGAPADLAGVRPGDMIVRCNDIEAISAEQVSRIEAQTAPGKPLRLRLLRAGVPFEVEVAVIQRPEVAA